MVPGLIATVEELFDPLFHELSPGAASAARVSQRADVQLDGAMVLGRALGRAPREVAAEVLAKAEGAGLGQMFAGWEVAGPGFINLVLSDSFLASHLVVMAGDDLLGVAPAPKPLKVVVDYASPNIAKEMHVGHLRSTIIGDSLVRMLTMVGMKVVRENHVGDWGTTFGMLLEHLVDIGEEEGAGELALGDLQRFYRDARSSYDNDPGFAERARARVVLLQSGDPETLRLWRLFVDQSLNYFDKVLGRLGTKLVRDDTVGESFYNPMLPAVVEDLREQGLLVESDGALCAFPPGFKNREGAPLPLIVQNSAGGFTYATTDLAAIRDRVGRQGAQLLLYVVGLPQSDHFQMVFETARMAGWLPAGTEAVHVGFGNVLGPDGKMLRTREGEAVKLVDLLDEAVERARAVIAARDEGGEQLSAEETEAVARAVGIGAVKYADLSTDRSRDYRFDWDRMLALSGNSAPYLQYAHARVRSIMARAAAQAAEGHRPGGAVMAPAQREERDLAKALLGFGDAVGGALGAYSPHKLCNYLFELAVCFTSFYEHCPVLKAEPGRRASRLALCDLTARVLHKGLDLLGIEAPQRM